MLILAWRGKKWHMPRTVLDMLSLGVLVNFSLFRVLGAEASHLVEDL